MARPWRDVLSVAEFEGMLADDDYVSASGAQARLIGSTPGGSLRSILDKLRLYHAVPKRDLNSLPRRRQLLQELSGLAQRYLTKFKVDLAVAAQRATRTVTPTGVERRRQTTSKDESLDRNLLTLQRRALRKQEYLVALENYCRANGAADFMRYMNGQVPQDRTNNLLGISPHNRAELEDFAHRDGFHNVALQAAFNDWLADNPGGNGIHFFLWLEGHEICLSQDQTSAAYVEVTPVEYVQNGTGASASSKFQHVHVLGMNLCKMDRTALDTYADHYKAEHEVHLASEKPVGVGNCSFRLDRTKRALYRRTPGWQISPLQSARRGARQCAGMIGLRAGKIEELSNNSGHYRPGLDNIRAFANQFRHYFCNQHFISAGVDGQGYAGQWTGLMVAGVM